MLKTCTRTLVTVLFVTVPDILQVEKIPVFIKRNTAQQ